GIRGGGHGGSCRIRGGPARPAPSRRPYGARVNELLRLALVGIAGGLGVFAVILLPAMWLQRRRFDMVRPPRLVGVALICVYTMSLAGLTIAPAYDVAVTCRSRSGGVARWDPFH